MYREKQTRHCPTTCSPATPPPGSTGGRSVNTMALAPRRREAVNYEAVYRYHPAFADRGLLWSEPHGVFSATVEGGDFQVLGNRALVMGLSHRSSAAGVERLATRLFDDGVADRVIGVHMPDRAFYTVKYEGATCFCLPYH